MRRLLCSSRPIPLRSVGTNAEMSEHDLVHEQQAKLALLCRRTMALSVGRGMFTLASSPAELVESLRLAPLDLKGRTSPKAATVRTPPALVCLWGGGGLGWRGERRVAAALRRSSWTRAPSRPTT